MSSDTSGIAPRPNAGELASLVAEFCVEQLDAANRSHLASWRLPGTFAGHQVGADVRADLCFTLHHLARAGVTEVADSPIHTIISGLLADIDGAGTHTFFSYRIAEMLLAHGPFAGNPLLANLGDDQVHQVALAVGRAALDEMIQRAMNEQFPGVNNGGSEVSTDEGTATLYTLAVTPSDPGSHDHSEGHLWASGSAEIHIDCWPDPDVTFDGPIFLRVVLTETEQSCSIEVQPEMGEFDAGQSCCDVFIDILIPVVGIVMLIVIESMIDQVGGELAADFAGQQARQIEAIPPFVAGVAELQACLENLFVSSQGLVFPGKLRIRREGRSFEDLSESGDLPRP